MKRATVSFRVRPQEPLDLAIWWIEHVIATHGAPLSQSLARHINWFVYSSMDVYLIMLGIVLLALIAVWQLLKVLRSICGRFTITSTSKAKQQ